MDVVVHSPDLYALSSPLNRSSRAAAHHGDSLALRTRNLDSLVPAQALNLLHVSLNCLGPDSHGITDSQRQDVAGPVDVLSEHPFACIWGCTAELGQFSDFPVVHVAWHSAGAVERHWLCGNPPPAPSPGPPSSAPRYDRRGATDDFRCAAGLLCCLWRRWTPRFLGPAIPQTPGSQDSGGKGKPSVPLA